MVPQNSRLTLAGSSLLTRQPDYGFDLPNFVSERRCLRIGMCIFDSLPYPAKASAEAIDVVCHRRISSSNTMGTPYSGHPLDG